MPELPEVETVRLGLVPAMEGHRIESIDLRRGDLRRPFPHNMAKRMKGQTVLRLRRRSKYILADLEGGETLLVHLGMSGRVLVSGQVPGLFHRNHAAVSRHDHVVLEMSSGARVTYNDARRFGLMDLGATETLDRHPLLARLGPEPLGNAFDEPYLLSALRGRRTAIKPALLDQRIVAGLGNIYACEVLHRAGISPLRGVDRISARRLATLVPAIREVLFEAIAAGGSSLRDHRQADGELGYFQHGFRTYDRSGAPCPTDGCDGRIRRIVQAGRATFYCPRCQR